MSADVTATRVWRLPEKGRVGISCLIAAEATMFVIFVVAYLFYLGKSLSGPTPQQVLKMPIIGTVCLLSSSATIAVAMGALRRGRIRAFTTAWAATIGLGVAFMVGTGLEWSHLILDEKLTPATNLFGTTYYSLVGLHALHVTVGLILLTTILALSLARVVRREQAGQVDGLAMYWHFVDAVWVVVFTTVYLIGR
jgi:cytochrome c oxidase subunit 3/cytochrome o ubiquinol oxidase subunit 3